MNNETKLKALNMWQKAGYVHEYTCICDGSPAMTPVEEEGVVRLKCDTCGRRQDHALDTAYDYYKNDAHEKTQKMLKNLGVL